MNPGRQRLANRQAVITDPGVRLPAVRNAALDQNTPRQRSIVSELEPLHLLSCCARRDLSDSSRDREFRSLDCEMRFEFTQTFFEAHDQNQMRIMAEPGCLRSGAPHIE